MFKCDKCRTLEESLIFERSRNKDLMDRLMALADARAFQAVKIGNQEYDPSEYFGGDSDVTEVRNEFGEKVMVKVKQ